MPESVFWRSRRGGGDLTDEEVPEAARELFETWMSFIQEPPFPEWNAAEAAKEPAGVDIGSEQREAWEKLTCLMAEPGVGQERLAMMLYAVGAYLGAPNLTRTLRRMWNGQEQVDLSAGGEEPGKAPAQSQANWVHCRVLVQTDKPDATDKRLAEMNGAQTALEKARAHLEALQGLQTGRQAEDLLVWGKRVRLIQADLRELAGKEDF